MRSQIKNNIIKQIIMLLIILILLVSIVWNLSYFIPGFLGAITLYILVRDRYFQMVEERGWKRWSAASIIILFYGISLSLPFYGTVAILSPMVEKLANDSDALRGSMGRTIVYLNEKIPQLELSTDKIFGYLQSGLTVVPEILRSTANILANILTAFFILYFMLVQGREMERVIINNLPLYNKNKNVLWIETKNMVVSNAIGIPLLALAQGLIAFVGYWYFDLKAAGLWALLTAFSTIIPVVGTMVVWVPICIYVFATNGAKDGLLLATYCFIAVGGIDNVLRILFVKLFGNVHPLITIFGVLLGLELFGIVGLIFGPLMLSYFILMIKIYKAEFGGKYKLLEHPRVEEEADLDMSNNDRRIILPDDNES